MELVSPVRDAITISSGKVPIAELPKALEELLGWHKDTSYKQKFPFVNDLCDVTERNLIDTLDELVADKISQPDLDGLWLDPPDILDWTRVMGFRYSKAWPSDMEPYQQLQLEDYLANHRPPNEITPKALRSDRIECVDEDGAQVAKWSIRKALVAEVEYDGEIFVLAENRWYNVSRDLERRVSNFIDNLPATDVDLPRCGVRTEDEYNARAAERSTSDLILLHPQLFPTGYGGERIEFCDLYAPSKALVHVKPYRGSKDLSHLWNQGRRAAEELMFNPFFRTKVNEALDDPHKVPEMREPLRPEDFELAFAVICKRGSDQLSLPFFSKVFFRLAAKPVCDRNMKVTLSGIPNDWTG